MRLVVSAFEIRRSHKTIGYYNIVKYLARPVGDFTGATG